MLTSLLLVATLLSCVHTAPPAESPAPSTQSEDTQELSSSSLVYVYAFFRHGIRSPLYETYKNDPYKENYHKIFKGKLGELTTKGKQQMYKVGKRLYTIYGKFVGDFSEEKVRASATEKSRTIMTALTVMAGLFPPKKPLMKGLNWQPIPIWQDTRDFDKVYFYNDPDFPKLALEQCPRYGQMIQRGYNFIIAPDRTKTRLPIYELLRQETGESSINSIDSVYKIYDILEMEELNGLELPEWATKPRPKFGNLPLYPDLMRPLQVEWFLKTQWLDRNSEMLSFYSGPLFDSINDKFADKITKKENKELFRFHDTHDDTIYTLRWALGLMKDNDETFEVQLGDGIVFELHKKKKDDQDKYFVQVVYYHSLKVDGDLKQFREVIDLPRCPSPCPKETFTKLYCGWTPKFWAEKCIKP